MYSRSFAKKVYFKNLTKFDNRLSVIHRLRKKISGLVFPLFSFSSSLFFLEGKERESCLADIERPSNVITLVVKHRLLDLKTTLSFTEPIEFHSLRKREVPAEIF